MNISPAAASAANRTAHSALSPGEASGKIASAVTISLVPQATGGPFVFWDGLADACAHAAALGFDAIELFAPSATAIDRAALRELLDRHHLRAAAFGTGGGWVVHRLHLSHPDRATRDAARAFIGEIIDIAAEFGAPAIVGSMQGRAEGSISRDEALELLGCALQELDGRAAGCGQRLLFEPLNRFETNLCNTLRDARTLIDTFQLTHTQVLADLFHMNIEEVSLADSIRTAASAIGHIHFADSNRHAIGFGHTDVAPIVDALRDIAWEGYLSAEILPLPDSLSAARQTMVAFSKWFQPTHPQSPSNA
jgi:sugar phosphate isomerase/epimerase